MIQVECDCGRVIKTLDENAGKKARCPDCGEIVRLPVARNGSAAKPVGGANQRTSNSNSRPAGKTARKRPPEDEFDSDDLNEEEAEYADFDDADSEELPPVKSKAASKKKPVKEKDSSEPVKKKKKKKTADDGELDRKIMIGTGVSVGLVVLGLLIYLVVKMPPASAAKVEVPKDFVAFSTSQGELRCQAPKDWPAKSGGGSGGVPPFATFENGGIKIQFRSSQSGAAFQTMAQAGSQKEEELRDEDKPVSQVHEIQKKKFEEEMSGYQEQGAPFMIKTAGFGEGRVSEFTASSGFSKNYGYRVTLLGTNNQWNVICMCPANQWKEYQPVFLKIVESAAGS